MPTLVATAGAVNANSYSTLAEADLYHEQHLYATTWTEADDDNKIIALIWATRVLDEEVDWSGTKSTNEQSLRWPRYDVYDRDGYALLNTTIPQFLKNATAELARHLLLKDRFQVMDENVAGLKSVTAGPVSVEFDTMDRIDLLPPSVLSMIKEFAKSGTGGMTIPLVRA